MAERSRKMWRHRFILQEKQLEPVWIIEDYLVIRSVVDFLSSHAEQGCVGKLEMNAAVCIPVLTMNSDLVYSVHCRVRVRYQKRQKLQFETKLGMNSPFWCVPSEDVCVESVLGTSRSVLESREGLNANTAEPSVNTSAQKHCNHQEEQISTKCHGGGFMTQILKLLRLLSERHLFSVGYQKGRKRKIPKQSFPMNRKEPKIGNYLLFGFSFKGMRMFSEEIFASALSLLLSISERLVHARSHLQECAWSQTIHWKLLHFQSMFSWHFYVIQWDTLNCVLPSHQSSLHSIEHLISVFSLQGKTHRKECPVQY